LKELGSSGLPIKMSRRPTTSQNTWIKKKYGKDIRPWESIIYFNNNHEVLKELPATITYKYSKYDENRGKKESERTNLRKFEVLKPEGYRGLRQGHDGKYWVING
jgi:hypothetical protein